MPLAYSRLAGGNTVYQHNVLGSTVSAVAMEEFLDPSMLPKLYDPWHWTNNLIGFITNRPISDMYYFGHGSNTFIGRAVAPFQITMAQVQTSGILKTNPMRYVGLDGCNSAKDTDMLNAYVGYKKAVTRPWFREKGFIPRFGWGWGKKKGVADYFNGSLMDAAFIYLVDFYQYLTHRDGSGLFDRTYEDAINFAKSPEGQGFPYPPYNNRPQYNTWAWPFNPMNYVGCTDCYFDE